MDAPVESLVSLPLPLAAESPAASSAAGSPPLGEAANGQHGSPASGIFGLAKAGPRSLDTTPPRSPLHARQMQERDIFSAVRRQLEAVEDRLGGQIARAQQQGERQRDTVLTRVESKLSTMEMLQPKVDRRLAELNGNLKALSEESQTQIRRMDQIDSRLWEWRHKMDEEIRAKFVSIEQASQELSSNMRVSKAGTEDVLKRYHQRLLRLEQLVDDRNGQHEDFSSSLMNMHTRLLEIEHGGSPALHGSTDIAVRDHSHGADVTILEGHVQDLTQKVTQLQEESYDLHSRVQSQEEHHRTLRTQFEAKDDLVRSLDERINRENWDSRWKDLQRSLDDVLHGHHGHSEQVQILQRKLDSHEETQAELSGHIRRLQERQSAITLDNPSLEAPGPRVLAFEAAAPAAVGASDEHLMRCVDRISAVENRIGDLQGKVDSMWIDLEVAPRVAALVDTLKDVSPKIISQEEAIKEVNAKADALESELGSVREVLGRHVGPLEAELRQTSESQKELRDLATGLATRVDSLEVDVQVQAKDRDYSAQELHTRVDRIEAEIPLQEKHQASAQELLMRVGKLEADIPAQEKHQASAQELLMRVGKLEAEIPAQETLYTSTQELLVRIGQLEAGVPAQAELRASAEGLAARLQHLEADVRAQGCGQAALRDASQTLSQRMVRLETEVNGEPGYRALNSEEAEEVALEAVSRHGFCDCCSVQKAALPPTEPTHNAGVQAEQAATGEAASLQYY